MSLHSALVLQQNTCSSGVPPPPPFHVIHSAQNSSSFPASDFCLHTHQLAQPSQRAYDFSHRKQLPPPPPCQCRDHTRVFMNDKSLRRHSLRGVDLLVRPASLFPSAFILWGKGHANISLLPSRPVSKVKPDCWLVAWRGDPWTYQMHPLINPLYPYGVAPL